MKVVAEEGRGDMIEIDVLKIESKKLLIYDLLVESMVEL